ncbi:hypothetical protein [Vibrio phage LP.2]|nr:hypothetical protein [Vibrio phage LP.2]
MTGDELKKLVGECETEICCPNWWDELAKLITEHEKKNPDERSGSTLESE